MNSMGHNVKKIAAAAVAAGLVLSLAGCTDKEEPSSEANSSAVSDMMSSTEDSEISSEIGSEISSGTEEESVPDSTSPAITDTKDELKPDNTIDPKDAAGQISGVDVPSTPSTPSESDNTSEPASSSSDSNPGTPVESKPSTPAESNPTPSSSSTPADKPAPSNPKQGDTKVENGVTYMYNDAVGMWCEVYNDGGCTGDASADKPLEDGKNIGHFG